MDTQPGDLISDTAQSYIPTPSITSQQLPPQINPGSMVYRFFL
jgi:hypothetical protein